MRQQIVRRVPAVAVAIDMVLCGASLAADRTVLAKPIGASSAVAAGPSHCSTVAAPALVYALDGSLYRIDPDGRNRCRLTPSVKAKEPHLSPGGKRVAFLSGTGSNGYGAGAVNSVRVLRVGRPVSAGTVVHVGRGVHRWPAWSPNGQVLAFIGESGVWVWRVACGCVRLVAPETAAEASETGIVWSPDSQHLAAAFVPLTSAVVPPWDHLRVTIVDAATGLRHAVVIRFPAWLRGRSSFEESYPSSVIAWLPNGQLLLGASGIGVGLRLTSIWAASPAGGAARMIVGTPKSPRIVVKFPLLNATTALVSPDGTMLLLNPGNRFWIASSSGHAGRLLALGIRSSCALVQAAWVGNTRLAYTTVCTLAAKANILARLYVLPLSGGEPMLLAAVRSPQQDQLSIAPPISCIACGAG